MGMPKISGEEMSGDLIEKLEEFVKLLIETPDLTREEKRRRDKMYKAKRRYLEKKERRREEKRLENTNLLSEAERLDVKPIHLVRQIIRECPNNYLTFNELANKCLCRCVKEKEILRKAMNLENFELKKERKKVKRIGLRRYKR
jgi:hypothetical protein